MIKMQLNFQDCDANGMKHVNLPGVAVCDFSSKFPTERAKSALDQPAQYCSRY